MNQRQLIVLCDGTNNTLTGGAHDTNVLQLAELLQRQNDPDQIVWYDPGVGSPSNMPGVTLSDRIKETSNRLVGLALGGGVYDNIAEAMVFLAQNQRDGDQIYLFGFSRGAFTARAVAGMLNEYGLPSPNSLHLLPLMIRSYFRQSKSEAAKKIILQTKRVAACRRIDVQFIGVWDTVESVGFPLPLLRKKITNPASIDGKNFLHVRHAVALDEFRKLFKPRLYQVSPTGSYKTRDDEVATLKQQAFVGCHTDVGGGYRRAGLSDEALRWMLCEARACGLRINVPQKFGARIIHSELHTTPLWAAVGQMVRDTRGVAASPTASTASQVPESVWQSHGHLRWGWLLLGFFAAVLGYSVLNLIDPNQAVLAWQLGAFWISPASIKHIDVTGYLFWDGVLIVGLLLTLSTLTSAAFARAAGLGRAGVAPPRILNALGQALPLYLAADVSENLLTWLLLNGSLWTCLNPWIAPFITLASVLKFVGLAGVVVLLVRGVGGEVNGNFST
jgi:Uncharacterized alpha/beta hydrolase domain (DUF2235)